MAAATGARNHGQAVTLLDGLLPQGTCWAVARIEEIEEAEASLTSGERAAIFAAVPARQREFALGRLCARRALLELGAVAEVAVGPRREPLWPAGVVGAITHQDGVALAAVARATDLAGLGVDLARNAPLPEGVLNHIVTAPERAWIEDTDGPLHWDTVVFSAKESLYKAISAGVGRFVDFHEATLERVGEALRVRGEVAGVPGDQLTLRHGVRGAWVVTTATLGARMAAARLEPWPGGRAQSLR